MKFNKKLMLIGLLSSMAFQGQANGALTSIVFGIPFLPLLYAAYNQHALSTTKKACSTDEKTKEAFEESLKKNDNHWIARYFSTLPGLAGLGIISQAENIHRSSYNYYYQTLDNDIFYDNLKLSLEQFNFHEKSDSNKYVNNIYKKNGIENNTYKDNNNNIYNQNQLKYDMKSYLHPDKNNIYQEDDASYRIDQGFIYIIGGAFYISSLYMLYLEHCRSCAIAQAKKDALEAANISENMTLEEPVISDEENQNNTIDEQIIDKLETTKQS